MKRKYTTLRCNRCHVAKSHCVCEIEPSLKSQHQINVIIHSEEFKKPTNTSFLAGNVFDNFKTLTWSRTDPDKDLLAGLEKNPHHYLVVFPSEKSVPLEGLASDSEGHPKSLIFLDGTWKQARKMYNLSPYLHKAPAVSISPNVKTEYQLRRQKKEYGLSTLESIAEVLKLLGEGENARYLKAYFRVFQWAYIQAKLNLPNNLDLASLFQEMLLSEKPNWESFSSSKSI